MNVKTIVMMIGKINGLCKTFFQVLSMNCLKSRLWTSCAHQTDHSDLDALKVLSIKWQGIVEHGQKEHVT